MRVTTYAIHIVPRLGMGGGTPLLPIYHVYKYIYKFTLNITLYLVASETRCPLFGIAGEKKDRQTLPLYWYIY